ncbi:MAG TPA: hypothetical protein VIL86_17060 [Tepidisphaeraceae bacterium]
MAAGGFNSLVLGIKWLTTGYRSNFSWLDQEPGNAAIDSDNATIHYALQQARRRGIRTWLLVVASQFDVAKFGFAPARTGYNPAEKISAYDLDQPGIPERILALFDEIATLFGAEADGIVVELEFCDGEAPHRIPIYNEWAEKNRRPPFEKIKAIALEPRGYPFMDWRDFTTSRRIDVFKQIETICRSAGFNGKFSSIAELGNAPTVVVGNVNLQVLRAALPHWALVTYDSIYDRRENRLATMDFCVEQPRKLGFEVLFLTRGVMTWTWPPDGPPMDLLEQWRMSLEDAARFDPEALWFMGSDARLDGLVCSNKKLPRWGFATGREARHKLIAMAKDLGVRIK